MNNVELTPVEKEETMWLLEEEQSRVGDLETLSSSTSTTICFCICVPGGTKWG